MNLKMKNTEFINTDEYKRLWKERNVDQKEAKQKKFKDIILNFDEIPKKFDRVRWYGTALLVRLEIWRHCLTVCSVKEARLMDRKDLSIYVSSFVNKLYLERRVGLIRK